MSLVVLLTEPVGWIYPIVEDFLPLELFSFLENSLGVGNCEVGVVFFRVAALDDRLPSQYGKPILESFILLLDFAVVRESQFFLNLLIKVDAIGLLQ